MVPAAQIQIRIVVGKLLKPGEEPADYSDIEEATDGGPNTSPENQ